MKLGYLYETILLLSGTFVIMALIFVSIALAVSVLCHIRWKNRFTYYSAMTSGIATFVLTLALLLIGFFSVGNFYKNQAELAKERLPDAPLELTAAALVYEKNISPELTFRHPSHWSAIHSLHDDALIRMGNSDREEYMIVLTDAKSEYRGNLEDHAETTSKSLLEGIENGAVVEKNEVLLGTVRALQYHISGSYDGLPIAYLHTTLEDSTGFHQILMWTIESRKKLTFNLYRRVLDSLVFEKLPPGPAAFPAPSEPSGLPTPAGLSEQALDQP